MPTGLPDDHHNPLLRSRRLQPSRVVATLIRMGFLVGTDEAGYGPNLGPLVISATAWEAPDGVGGEDLLARLGGVIASTLDAVCKTAGPYVAMADSKVLYSPTKGLGHLERGVFAGLGLLGFQPRTWREIWRSMAPESIAPMPSIPWYAGYDAPAPLACDADDIERLVATLKIGLAAAGVRLIGMQSRVVFEQEFNDLLDNHSTKGDALSHATLELAARMVAALPPGPVSMVCDKHGGRDYYMPVLTHHFPEWLIEVRVEGRRRSEYRFGPPERRVDVCFRSEGEASLPAALASMASKYLRELAMRSLNHYWCGRVPGLQPTAGYPQDAKRFRADVAETQSRLKISDRAMWRMK